MATHLAVRDARISEWSFDANDKPVKWIVSHPSNDAILAYCDSLADADRVVVGLNDLAKALERGWAFSVAPR